MTPIPTLMINRETMTTPVKSSLPATSNQIAKTANEVASIGASVVNHQNQTAALAACFPLGLYLVTSSITS